MDAAIKLLGKQAQKVVTDASTSEGIRSDTVASDATSGIVVVWVYRADPGDNFQVTLFDVTASQDRGTVKYDTAGWATRVDANGNTWKRLVITSSSLVNGNNHQIDIYRHSADASQATTFYVDQCYLQFGTTAIPTGWSSERTLINHYDQGEGHINYVDVADLPGNALPKIKLQLDITDAGSDLAVPNLLWSRRNKNIDGGFVWFLNATDGTVGTDTSLSADTGAPGGQKAVCDFSTTTTEAERLRIELSSVEPMVGRYRVLLLARQTAGAADDIVVTQVSLDDGGATATLTYDSNTNLPTLPISSTLWTVVDLGVMRVPGFTHPEDYLSDEDFAVRILARRDAGTANLEIAGAIFLPAGESAFTAALTAQTGTFEFHLDSLLVPPSHYQTIGGANPVYAPGLGLLGQFPDAMPGELNRW
ncbi:MAG: hypothetical protein GTO63_27630, partial [Anaerolineae bacterium]|nr:hypothetical protein [Anaerolineae bacterium]NIN98502.1 hypothetical protein [Anaerolineae bacterium]